MNLQLKFQQTVDQNRLKSAAVASSHRAQGVPCLQPSRANRLQLQSLPWIQCRCEAIRFHRRACP